MNNPRSKQPLPPPNRTTMLKSFGRYYIGGIGFIYLLRKSSSFLNKKIGSSVCFLATYGIPQWTQPVSPPALEAKTTLGSFQKPNNKQMRQGYFFYYYYLLF